MQDVARLAGVSHGTVSHVLNHPERVSAAKREAVERAIRELGFVRNEPARHLRAGYSSTVGLLLLDAWNPGFADVARGVEAASTDRGMSVLIANSARDIERERSYLRLFAEERLAGVIAIPHDEYDVELHHVSSGGIPLVIVDRVQTGDQVSSLAVDDVAGGLLAAGHLIAQGHLRLAFVGDESLAVPVHDRLAGVRKAVADAGPQVSLEVLPADLTVEGGRDVGEALARMASTDRPTGVTTATDPLAIGVLQGLRKHDVRVPEDVSLVGYDDIPFAAELSVPLTTVRRPHYEMGRAAVEMLTLAMSGAVSRPRHVLFSPRLIVRDSTRELSSRPLERKLR